MAGGQFLENTSQRGIFGTAAALRVIATSREPRDRAASTALVRYVRERRQIELRPGRLDQAARGRWVHKLDRDDEMTVRQAELLVSLTSVPAAVAPCDDLKTTVSTRLLNGRARDGSGWGDRLGATTGGNVLATAHAIRALWRNGNDVAHEIEALKTRLLGRAAHRDDDRDTAYVDCFATLVMHEMGVLRSRQARQVFDHLWTVLGAELESDRETTLEVLGGDNNDYVRVPWQLHLIALSALIRPWRRYLSSRIQRRLRSVVDGVLGAGGFQYGGGVTSLRTYAYIDETLSAILHVRPNAGAVDTLVAKVLRTVERPLAATVRIASVVLLLGCLALTAVSLWSWHRHHGRIGDVAPNFIAAAVLAALAYAFHRSRRR